MVILCTAMKAGRLGQGLIWLAGTIKAGIASATAWVVANPLLAAGIGEAVVGTVGGAIAIFL